MKVWFVAMLPIETARLRLRRFVPGDVAALHAIHSRADVTRLKNLGFNAPEWSAALPSVIDWIRGAG